MWKTKRITRLESIVFWPEVKRLEKRSIFKALKMSRAWAGGNRKWDFLEHDPGTRSDYAMFVEYLKDRTPLNPVS